VDKTKIINPCVPRITEVIFYSGGLPQARSTLGMLL
jgi:hypothetical protein